MLRAIERATRQPIEPMQLPSVEAVNDQRVARFLGRITDALERRRSGVCSATWSSATSANTTCRRSRSPPRWRSWCRATRRCCCRRRRAADFERPERARPRQRDDTDAPQFATARNRSRRRGSERERPTQRPARSDRREAGPGIKAREAKTSVRDSRRDDSVSAPARRRRRGSRSSASLQHTRRTRAPRPPPRAHPTSAWKPSASKSATCTA